MRRPLISVIMPTYNSEKTIDKALKSIREQSIDEGEIEDILNEYYNY